MAADAGIPDEPHDFRTERRCRRAARTASPSADGKGIDHYFATYEDDLIEHLLRRTAATDSPTTAVPPTRCGRGHPSFVIAYEASSSGGAAAVSEMTP